MAYDLAADFPTIDPASFDVVICGTGFPEAVLAAACAAAGKTVLHVDPNPFYGSLSSSIPPLSLPSFLNTYSSTSTDTAVHLQRRRLYSEVVLNVDPNPFYGSLSSSIPPLSLPSFLTTYSSTSTSTDTVVHLQRRRLYSEVETSGTIPEPSNRFTVDLVGPRVLYCADEAVDLLQRSGGSNHVEFKSMDGGTLLYWDGDLFPVPNSRECIFQDSKIMSVVEKFHLYAFFKLVLSHIAKEGGEEGKEASSEMKISEEDLNIPFIEFLKKQQLSLKMIAAVLYAIVMADYDQDAADTCEKLLTTRDGIKAIALYLSSVGRFANAQGAFIYPMYGHGELPQAFCRFAAVKGALYVLRMPITALLMDKEKQRFIGTRLASGQDILCQQLIFDPSYEIPSLGLPSDASNSASKVARGICIIRKSVKQNSSNVLVIFPPKSLQEQQVAAVRVLQLGSNVAVCPPGMFIAYLSTPCADAFTGKLFIKKAIEVLFSSETSNGSDGLQTTSEDIENARPVLLWNCVYVQEIAKGTSGNVLSCPMPDEYVDYRNILELIKKLFTDTYPNEEFLPGNSAPEYADDDTDSAE